MFVELKVYEYLSLKCKVFRIFYEYLDCDFVSVIRRVLIAGKQITRKANNSYMPFSILWYVAP